MCPGESEGLKDSCVVSSLLEQQMFLTVTQCLALLLDLADPVVQSLLPSHILYLPQAWLSHGHQKF